MKRPALLIALAAAVAGPACDDSPVAPSEIVGITWNLTSVELPGADPIVVEDPSRYTLRFEDAGTVALRADCNTCSANYTLDGDDLDIGAVACTLMACGSDTLDPAWLTALEAAETVSVSPGGDEMTISGSGATLRFEQ